MTRLGEYLVSVQTRDADQQTALLTPALMEDMPSEWTFDWPGLWQRTDISCQNIVKLVYEEQVWGLVRYGLYPYPGTPRFLEIEQLEANPTSRGETAFRLIEPIGKWLIWYATQVGLQSCEQVADDTLIFLVSFSAAVSYYRDIVQMQYFGPTTIAPGEDGYAFRFSRTEAAAFCRRQENQWGVPTPLNSR